jgi:TetR/AcrR family transcriptional regulator, ethionamide resistance regulator
MPAAYWTRRCVADGPRVSGVPLRDRILAVSTPPTGPRLDAAGPDTRRESTERRILESAQQLIDGGVGWHQLGIRQIAERAAISRTAFYDFFGSKNEVLEHLIRGLYEDLSGHLREALDPEETGTFDLRYLRPGLRTIAGFATQHGFAYRALLDAAPHDARLADLWEELIEGYTGLIASAIEAVRDAQPSAPRAIDAAAIARALVLMTERCLILDTQGQEPQTLGALADVWEHTVYGVSPAPGR